MLSRIWYVAHVFPLPEKLSQKIVVQIGKFLWANNLYRVGRNQLYNETEKGGLKLINVAQKAKSILIKTYLKQKKDNPTSELIQTIENQNRRSNPFFQMTAELEKNRDNIDEDMTSKDIYRTLLVEQLEAARIEEKYMVN